MSFGRRIAGIVVLLALTAIGGFLIVPYGRNYQFQNSLDDIVSKATNADALQAEAVDKAASLGIPLRSPDVKVIPLPGGGFRVDAIYLVRVDLGFYAVDLHFHPAAEK
jgi:hypothetical protein